jgi:hypothetical protein
MKPGAGKVGGRGRLVAASLLASSSLALGVFVWLGDSDDVEGEASLAPTLENDMRSAVSGHPSSGSGPWRVSFSSGDGGGSVVASGVPRKDCVAAAWSLAKEGRVVVTGAFSRRLSAAILSDLCSGSGETAILEWFPR